jgi:hypothetical protein
MFIRSVKLTPIGTVHGQCKTLTEGEKDKLLSIPVIFIGILVGLIEGDGYISIVNSGRDFIKLDLIIALAVRD